MIVGFIGKMGSGKTLSMTKELHKYYLLGNTILSNYGLAFDHHAVNFDTLYDWAEEQKPMGDIVLALDEIHIMLDSRSSISNMSKVMTFWLNQTRKMNVKLFYTTQYLHQVDKRLRNGTDLFVFCNGMHVTRHGQTRFVCFNEITDGDFVKKEIFLGDRYFQLYDTNEVIAFVDRKGVKNDGKGKEGAEGASV
jgi:hypothetical protein